MSNPIGLSYIKVSHRENFFGLLRFNLYLNDLTKQILANTKQIQYADNTIVLLYYHSYIQYGPNIATFNLEQSLRKIFEYYDKNIT